MVNGSKHDWLKRAVHLKKNIILDKDTYLNHRKCQKLIWFKQMSVSSEQNWKIFMQTRLHAYMCVHKIFLNWCLHICQRCLQRGQSSFLVFLTATTIRTHLTPVCPPCSLYGTYRKKILTCSNLSSLGSSLFFGYKIKRHFSVKFEKLPLQLNNQKNLKFRSFHSLTC